MKPIDQLPSALCRGLRGILCDLDDTLTLGGKLGPEAFAALWRAHRAGLRVVVVTGRPAGWADHMARMWPLDAVIGENGAFYFHLAKGRMVRRWVVPEAERRRHRAQLDALGQDILRAVPGAAISADQFCRAADLAIDLCEDVEPLGEAATGRIVALFEAAGARAKVSSIHVNGWLGDFDKLSCFRLLASELWGEDGDACRERYVYCGDSPNDEPMFAFFPHACAVANVAPFLDRLRSLPAYVTRSQGGEGFTELIDEVLARRGEG